MSFSMQQIDRIRRSHLVEYRRHKADEAEGTGIGRKRLHESDFERI